MSPKLFRCSVIVAVTYIPSTCTSKMAHAHNLLLMYNVNCDFVLVYLQKYFFCKRTFCTVELQWLDHLMSHENMLETGVVQANES